MKTELKKVKRETLVRELKKEWDRTKVVPDEYQDLIFQLKIYQNSDKYQQKKDFKTPQNALVSV